jgi:hypothetical protein
MSKCKVGKSPMFNYIYIHMGDFPTLHLDIKYRKNAYTFYNLVKKNIFK